MIEIPKFHQKDIKIIETIEEGSWLKLCVTDAHSSYEWMLYFNN